MLVCVVGGAVSEMRVRMIEHQMGRRGGQWQLGGVVQLMDMLMVVGGDGQVHVGRHCGGVPVGRGGGGG